MIDFMLIGLPRSGTTWAANWLTGADSLCVHDPLWTVHYTDLDATIPSLAGDRLAGISCTGIWNWPDWLNAHPARKVILHRSLHDIRSSESRLGIPLTPLRAPRLLERIEGYHVTYDKLFSPLTAEEIWDHLSDVPFDAERHDELRQMYISPNFATVRRDMRLNARIAAELS